MLVQTTRFGQIEAQQDQIIVFPQGLIGFEACRHWLIVPDPHNHDVAWLQSLSQMQVALPMVSPRKFAPDYKVNVSKRDLALLNLRNSDRLFVMTIVSKSGKTLTANLRSPLLVNLTKCLACQVITSDPQPLALPLSLGAESRLRVAA
jgi:flagellar assembly factor FliW